MKESTTNKKNKIDEFSNRFGVLAAMVGSAVGLGNLWRFPYLTGQHGGATFIIIYLACIVFLCMPVMIAEFVMGRSARTNSVSAYQKIINGKFSGLIGWCGPLASFFILAFYSVVGGWSLKYLIKALTFSFTLEAAPQSGETFNSFITSNTEPIAFCLVFLLMTAGILLGGVKSGIEKTCKVMTPLLFVMVVFIAIRSMTLPGAEPGIEYLFKPDFSKVGINTILAALGQAFFSLSLGAGMIVTYGSYVKKSENIIKCSLITTISDTLFALIAGLAILPAVFAFGESPSEGPGLAFVVLPQIFAQFKMGGIIAILFFFTLFLAAITSSISILEVIVATVAGKFNLSRKNTLIILLCIFFVVSSVCSLSQGVLSDFTIFGKNIFDLFDYVSANILMIISGFAIVYAIGWKMGRERFIDEITNSGKLNISPALINAIFFAIKYIAPLVILVVFTTSIIK